MIDRNEKRKGQGKQKDQQKGWSMKVVLNLRTIKLLNYSYSKKH